MVETPEAPPPLPKPKPRWKRVLLLGGGGILLLLGLLVAFLPAILSSGTVREIVRSRASEASGRHIALGALDVGWSATAVRDLEVRAGPGEGDPILAKVGEIRVPAGITLAFASRYDVGPIEVIRPEIRVDLREVKKAPPKDGPKGNGGGGGSPPREVPPFSVKVKVTGGTLVLVDLEGKERRLASFSADLSAASEGPVAISLVLDAGAEGGGTATLSARVTREGDVEDGTAAVDVLGLAAFGLEEPEIHAGGGFRRGRDGALEVRDGFLRMKGLDARASASLSPAGSVTGALVATAALDLATDRAKRLGVPFDGWLVGDATIDVRALSDGKADRFSGTVALKDAQFAFGPKAPPIEEPSILAAFDVVREGTTWTVGSASVKSATADLDLAGTATQDLSAADLRARARVRLGPACRIAKAFGAALPEVTSGDLDFDATLVRKGKEGDLAKGSVVVTDLIVRPTGEEALPVHEPRLTLEFEAVPGPDILDVRRLQWTGASAKVGIVGWVGKGGTSGGTSTFEANGIISRVAHFARAFGLHVPEVVDGQVVWTGSVSWEDTFGTLAAKGTMDVGLMSITLSQEHSLRQDGIRTIVDLEASRTKAGYDVRIGQSTFTGLGIDLGFSGSVAAGGTPEISLKGTASLPEVLSRAVQMKYIERDPATRGDLDFDLGVKGRRVEVRSLAARDAEFDLRASGTADLDGAADLALDAGGDLAVLLDLAARAGLLDPVKDAAGKATLRGTVKAAGADAPLRLALEAGVVGLRWPDPKGGAPWTQKGVTASLAADVDRKASSATGTLDLRADDGGIRITGTADRAVADLRADVDFDAGGFFRSRPDLLPHPDTTVGRVKGAARAKVDLEGPFDVAKVDAGARLSIDAVKTEPAEFRDASVDLVLGDGVLRATRIAASVNGGTVSGTASIGIAGEAPKHSLDLKGEGIAIDKAMTLLLKKVVPLFAIGDTGVVEGKFRFDLHLEGAGTETLPLKKSLVGKGNLAVIDGSLARSGMLGDILEFLDGGKEMSFDSVSTDFLVHDRRVWNERLLVDGKDSAMVFKGTTAFNGDLDYRIGVKGLRLGKRAMDRIRPLLDRDGNLPLTLSGNLSKPKIKGPDLRKGLKGLLGGGDD